MAECTEDCWQTALDAVNLRSMTFSRSKLILQKHFFRVAMFLLNKRGYFRLLCAGYNVPPQICFKTRVL